MRASSVRVRFRRLRLLALLAVLALVAAACGDDGGLVIGETDDRGVPADATAPPTPDTVGPDGSPPSDDGGTDGDGGTATTGGPAPGPGTAPNDPAGPASTATTQATSAPVPAPGGVGGFAAFYLRPAESEAIVLDVHSQGGAEPTSTTLDHARAVLAQVSGKSVSVSGGSLDGGARQWSAADIRALADQVGRPQSRDAAALTLLYLRGGFAESDTVVGVAVRSDVAAVFADKVSEAAGVLGNRTAVEDAVTIHEIGHILGLVDLVLDTGREDPEHPGHSRNTGSVMYYAVESTVINTVLSGGPPRDFDDADRADLARIRNG